MGGFCFACRPTSHLGDTLFAMPYGGSGGRTNVGYHRSALSPRSTRISGSHVTFVFPFAKSAQSEWLCCGSHISTPLHILLHTSPHPGKGGKKRWRSRNHTTQARRGNSALHIIADVVLSVCRRRGIVHGQPISLRCRRSLGAQPRSPRTQPI